MAPCFLRLGFLNKEGIEGPDGYPVSLGALVSLLDGNRFHNSLCDIVYDHREDVLHFLE